ncbi:MAG: HAD family hydrolase [Actinomycetia bacterium]|nr:HAD family hydrolase [Actinomycetes bacterium]
MKAVLFDAGGTLVLQHPDLMSEVLGVDMDQDSCFKAHYLAMDAYSRLHCAGTRRNGWEWWLEHYFTTLRVPSPSEAGPKIRFGHGMWSLPIPGVEEGVSRLLDHGIRCAVISNSDGSIRRSLTEAGLSHLFEFVIDSSEVGCRKPQREIFEMGVEELGGVAPGEVAYVGDSVFHDVNGALQAGYGQAWLVDPLDLYPDHTMRVVSVSAIGEALQL